MTSENSNTVNRRVINVYSILQNTGDELNESSRALQETSKFLEDLNSDLNEYSARRNFSEKKTPSPSLIATLGIIALSVFIGLWIFITYYLSVETNADDLDVDMDMDNVNSFSETEASDIGSADQTDIDI